MSHILEHVVIYKCFVLLLLLLYRNLFIFLESEMRNTLVLKRCRKPVFLITGTIQTFGGSLVLAV